MPHLEAAKTSQFQHWCLSCVCRKLGIPGILFSHVPRAVLGAGSRFGMLGVKSSSCPLLLPESASPRHPLQELLIISSRNCSGKAAGISLPQATGQEITESAKSSKILQSNSQTGILWLHLGARWVTGNNSSVWWCRVNVGVDLGIFEVFSSLRERIF